MESVTIYEKVLGFGSNQFECCRCSQVLQEKIVDFFPCRVFVLKSASFMEASYTDCQVCVLPFIYVVSNSKVFYGTSASGLLRAVLTFLVFICIPSLYNAKPRYGARKNSWKQCGVLSKAVSSRNRFFIGRAKIGANLRNKSGAKVVALCGKSPWE